MSSFNNDEEADPLLPPAVEHGGMTERDEKAYRTLRRGFYCYTVASEVFIIVSATLFIPLLLETIARSNGFLAPDYTLPCPASGRGKGGEEGRGGRCDVRLGGRWVDTASFSLMTYSASVLLQALTVISMGSLADDPKTRHRLLTSFALSGSLFTISFLAVSETSAWWTLCTLLAAGSNVSFGASIVCLNSYLPDLGRRSPTVQLSLSRLLTLQRSPTSSSPSSLAAAQTAYIASRGLSTSRISSRAVAAGYAAGIGVLVALLPVVKWLSEKKNGKEGAVGTWPLRVAVAASGGWWLLGTIPAAFLLRPPPSSSSTLDSSPTRREKQGKRSCIRHVQQGWRGLGTMLGEWRRLPQTFVFLAAWFVLSDAYATLSSSAILFAKTTLNLPTSSLTLLAILSPLSGMIGAVGFPLLQKRGSLRSRLPLSSSTPASTSVSPTPTTLSALSIPAAPPTKNLSNHSLLLLLVSLSLFIPLWGLLSLHTPIEMYLLAIIFGSLYGAFQSYARTCFAELVPPGQSARWFALWSVTDKSSSFLGPLAVAGLTEWTGQIRHGFYIILFLFLISLPILWKVDMVKGSADAERYERETRQVRAEGTTEGEAEGLLAGEQG